MRTQDAIDIFGTQRALADELGITQAAVAGWGEYPPAIRQIQISRIPRAMRAGLKVEPDIFRKKSKATA